MKILALLIIFSNLVYAQSSQAVSCFEALAFQQKSRVTKYSIARSQIELAAKQIKKSGLVQRTPLVKSEVLSKRFGVNVFLKLDYQQNIGAFKIRGAVNALYSLIKKKKSIKGVITASSGNHAQGMALAAKELKVPAIIVMAENASHLKIEKVRKLGAEVVLHGRSFEEAEAFAQELAERNQYDFIHPFANDHVMAGQGTIGLEITQQMKPYQTNTQNDLLVVAPIGGGGLIAGISSYLKSESSAIKTLGVQANTNSYMAEAVLNRTDLVKKSTQASFADGAAVTMVNERIKNILSQNLDFVSSVEEREIIQAMLDLESEGFFVEGAAALSLAGLNRFAQDHADKMPENVVLVLTGKNLAPDKRQGAIDSIK